MVGIVLFKQLYKLKSIVMKLLKALSIVLVAHTLLSSTCSKKDDDVAGAGGNISGSWRIALYWDNTDETADFAGYRFTFNGNGQLMATHTNGTVTGSWTETGSKLIIDFGTHPVLSELNDDWLKVDKTASVIKLKDDNPAQDDRLEFVKN
jgi:hypothetical protein